MRLSVLLLLAPSLLAATCANAQEVTLSPRDANVWYSIQPSQEAGGPFVVVSFMRGFDRKWTARRLTLFEDMRSSEPIYAPVVQTAEEKDCPQIGPLAVSVEPYLKTSVKVKTWEQKDILGVTDGWSVRVGARGRLADGGLGSVEVEGNIDLPATKWAFDAEKSLMACWGDKKPVS